MATSFKDPSGCNCVLTAWASSTSDCEGIDPSGLVRTRPGEGDCEFQKLLSRQVCPVAAPHAAVRMAGVMTAGAGQLPPAPLLGEADPSGCPCDHADKGSVRSTKRADCLRIPISPLGPK